MTLDTPRSLLTLATLTHTSEVRSASYEEEDTCMPYEEEDTHSRILQSPREPVYKVSFTSILGLFSLYIRSLLTLFAYLRAYLRYRSTLAGYVLGPTLVSKETYTSVKRDLHYRSTLAGYVLGL